MESLVLVGLLALFIPSLIVSWLMTRGLNARLGNLEQSIKIIRAKITNLEADIEGGVVPKKDEEGNVETVPIEPEAELLDADPEKEAVKAPEEPDASPELPEAARTASFESAGESVAEAAETGSLPPKRDWEKLIGERWTVLLGGLAIAFGAVFLVRYSIEQGLLGPAARVALGALLSMALFAGGEWLRRKDRALNLPVMEKADIPGIITGAGSIAAFATLYAAHALYGFVGPGIAFVGLTVIGIATMALSSIHGPKLAAIGVLGSYATPILVSSDAPNPIALVLHVLVVTATVMAIAKMRLWLWLAIAGIVASLLYALLATTITAPLSPISNLLYVAVLPVIYTLGLGGIPGFSYRNHEDESPDWLHLIAMLALVFVMAVQAGSSQAMLFVPTGLAFGLIVVAAGLIRPAFAASALASSFSAFVLIAALKVEWRMEPGMVQGIDFIKRNIPPDVTGFVIQAFVIAAPAALLAVFGVSMNGRTAPRMTGWLASAAALTALLASVAVYIRVAPFETSFPIALACLVLALLLAGFTEHSARLRPDDLSAPAPAAFAVGSISLLSLAIGVALSKFWMPLGFSVMALGIAWVYSKRPVATLPWLSLLAGALGGVALYFSAPYRGAEIGTTPILNGLIILIGLPALSLLVAGEFLARLKSDLPGKLLTFIGLAAFALFASFQLRHLLNDGNITSPFFDLSDMAAQTLAALGFTIGLQKVKGLATDGVFKTASLIAGLISIAMAVLGLIVFFNPLLTNDHVGGSYLLNLLLPAYLLTGVLAGVIALMSRGIRPRWYTLGYAGLGGALLFLFVTMTVRHAFLGEQIGLIRPTSDLEFWTYSPVWLALGGVILAVGFVVRSLPVRAAAAGLIALTVLKVFLLDMAELEGVLRALSFLGLGLVLILIGRFYQRMLGLPPKSTPEPEVENPE